MAVAMQDITELLLLDKPPSIGQRIRELRQARGWALDRLARETGLSRGTIWEAENRINRVPWHTTLEKIAEAFEVPVDYLRTGELPTRESNLSEFSPEMYGRAQGIRDPKRLEVLREIVEDFRRLDELNHEVDTPEE